MKINCFTCKYGYEDERLGVLMCHHPRRFSEDCVNFNMHEEKEIKESEKPMKQEKEVEPCHRTRKRLAEWSNTPEGRVAYEKVAEEMRKKIIPNDLEEAANKFAVFYDQGTCDGIAQDCFIAGAKWQKEQLMKDAVESTVMDFSSNQPRPQVDVLLDPHKYHTGDKVRVIIVKEN